jgi:hypothetical protein
MVEQAGFFGPNWCWDSDMTMADSVTPVEGDGVDGIGEGDGEKSDRKKIGVWGEPEEE